MSEPLYPRHASAPVEVLVVAPHGARWLRKSVYIDHPRIGNFVKLSAGWIAGIFLQAVEQQHPEALGREP